MYIYIYTYVCIQMLGVTLPLEGQTVVICNGFGGLRGGFPGAGGTITI